MSRHKFRLFFVTNGLKQTALSEHVMLQTHSSGEPMIQAGSKGFFYARKYTTITIINDAGETLHRWDLVPHDEGSASSDTLAGYRTHIEDQVRSMFDSMSEAHRCAMKIHLVAQGYTMNGPRGSMNYRYNKVSKQQFDLCQSLKKEEE